jgi:hypothetical protein
VDPEKTIARVMDDKYSSGTKLRELIDLTAGDEAARTGLKAAVRDYLVEKATNTGSTALLAGDNRGPVSLAKLSKIFNEHANELAAIFSPDEMNTLRAGHKALDLTNINSLRISKGSNTVENKNIIDHLRNSPIGKGIEGALRVKYGMLKTGGLIATGRRLAEGIGQGDADDAMRLIERAAYDPKLMALLLGKELKVASPRWNARLNLLLGATEGAREAYDEDEPVKAPTPAAREPAARRG